MPSPEAFGDCPTCGWLHMQLYPHNDLVLGEEPQHMLLKHCLLFHPDGERWHDLLQTHAFWPEWSRVEKERNP